MIPKAFWALMSLPVEAFLRLKILSSLEGRTTVHWEQSTVFFHQIIFLLVGWTRNDMLGSQMVSEASISLTGAPPEPHGGVAPLAPAEQVGTADSQPTVPPRKRGRKKATTTPSSTLLVPQDGPSSAAVKEEQMAPLSAIDPAPKKTKKVSKQQKTWKVTPNSRESVEFSRQSSKKPLVTLPAIAQQNKLCSVPRIWTSDKTELLASLPILGPARCVNGFSWTHSHTPFVVLDDGPKSTRPVDLVQLDTRSEEFIFDLFGTRALVTVGASAKTNIAEGFEPIPIPPDVGTLPIPPISTSSKRVHFAENTRADPIPLPTEDPCSVILPSSPPVEETPMAVDNSGVAPEAPAVIEQVDMPPCPCPPPPPPPPPQETYGTSIVLDEPLDRIRHVMDDLDRGALELASHFKVALPLDLCGTGESNACRAVGEGGDGLLEGPDSEGAVAEEVQQETPNPQPEADKPMDIDEPLIDPPSSPLTELSSDEEEEEICQAADRMDVDVDQENFAPSTSTTSSKVGILPCGCGKTWSYVNCTEHFPQAALSSSTTPAVPEEWNEWLGRPKRKAAVQSGIRIQDQAKMEGPRPRRSKAAAAVKQEEDSEEVKFKAEEVEAVIANLSQSETKSESDPKGKRKGKGKERDVPVVESPTASVRVKVAKHSRRGKIHSDVVGQAKPANMVSLRLSTLRKRKGGVEEGNESTHSAAEAEEPLPSLPPRKRRRKSAGDELPPSIAASSPSTTMLEPTSNDNQLPSAPALEPSSEDLVVSQPPELDVRSPPPPVNEVTDTSIATPSSLHPEIEQESASACANSAFLPEPVIPAIPPPPEVVMEDEPPLAEDGPPSADGLPDDPSPTSAPPAESNGVSDNNSIGRYEPLPSLPSEIRALIDAYVAGTPLAIIASRSRTLELFSYSRPQLDLQEQYGFACLGLFEILGLEERIVPSVATTVKAASSQAVHVEWKFRLQWTSGGEDLLKQTYEGWELARPCDVAEANAAPNDLIPPTLLELSSSPETHPLASSPSDEAESSTDKDKEASLFKIDTPQLYLHVRKSHPTYGMGRMLIKSGFYSLVHESLLSLFTPFLSNEAFPSGWFCTACGKVNFQAAMRHRKCTGLDCSKDTTPALSYAQELPDIRGVFSDSPSCLPFNDYAEDVRGSSTSWSSGMRTLGYHFGEKKARALHPPPEKSASNQNMDTDTQVQASTSGEGSNTQAQIIPEKATSPGENATVWVKHVYTCNLPHLQNAASGLMRRMQTDVELRRPMGDGSNPFFERTHNLAAPISGSADEVVTGVKGEIIPSCLVDAGKLLFKRATAYAEISKERMIISRLNALAWITAGIRKNQDILCAKKHPIAILCLGCDVIVTLTPTKVTATTVVSKTSTKKAGRKASKKGKEPQVQLDMSTLISFEDDEKQEQEKEKEGGEEEVGGPGAEADGDSGGDNHAPLASTSSSSQFPSLALATASKLPEGTVQLTMVHGDVLVVSGEDYVFSLKRSGCGILVFGSKAV
ncbi:hypothetical protein MD484_g3333, partial [Candolleomyces efflorescens]